VRSTAETAVCNTGPLIALGKIGQLHLLSALFPRVPVPGAVWQEIVQSRRGPEPEWLHPETLPFEIINDLPPADPVLIAQLDAGEAAVLMLAR